jgi:hypothetical protein
MTLFLDFILINTQTNRASGIWDHMLPDSTKVTEATAAFHQTATVMILQSLHAKERKSLSIEGDGSSSQRDSLSEESGLEYFQNLLSSPTEFPDVKESRQVYCPWHLVNLGLSDAISVSGHIRRYRAALRRFALSCGNGEADPLLGECPCS